MYPHHTGVTNLRNTTNSEDTITIIWDAATSPYCGGILYYIVMISSDEHSNIMNDIVNVTSPLTTTFSNLRNDTYYVVRVTTVYSRLGDGGTTKTVIIRTSSPPTQSNNTSNNGTDNPSSNNTGM